jgi:hypothetical protein
VPDELQMKVLDRISAGERDADLHEVSGRERDEGTPRQRDCCWRCRPAVPVVPLRMFGTTGTGPS